MILSQTGIVLLAEGESLLYDESSSSILRSIRHLFKETQRGLSEVFKPPQRET